MGLRLLEWKSGARWISGRSGASSLRCPRSRRPESNFSVDVDLAWKERSNFKWCQGNLRISLLHWGYTCPWPVMIFDVLLAGLLMGSDRRNWSFFKKFPDASRQWNPPILDNISSGRLSTWLSHSKSAVPCCHQYESSMPISGMPHIGEPRWLEQLGAVLQGLWWTFFTCWEQNDVFFRTQAIWAMQYVHMDRNALGAHPLRIPTTAASTERRKKILGSDYSQRGLKFEMKGQLAKLRIEGR